MELSLQIADSGNRLAAIVSIAGISLPLQLKRILTSMPISAIIQFNSGRPIAAKNQRPGFQRGILENF
jgi:hypothetical protein